MLYTCCGAHTGVGWGRGGRESTGTVRARKLWGQRWGTVPRASTKRLWRVRGAGFVAGGAWCGTPPKSPTLTWPCVRSPRSRRDCP
eukprot:1090984-Prymnesium_polylepis.1